MIGFILMILAIISVICIISIWIYEFIKELAYIETMKKKTAQEWDKVTETDSIFKYLSQLGCIGHILTIIGIYRKEIQMLGVEKLYHSMVDEGYLGWIWIDQDIYATPLSRTAGELLQRQDYNRKAAQQLLGVIQNVQTAIYNLRADVQKIDERLDNFLENLRDPEGRKYEDVLRGIFIDEYGGSASISSLATGRATGGKPVQAFRSLMMWFYRVHSVEEIDSLIKQRKINPVVGAILKRKLVEYYNWKENYLTMLLNLKKEVVKNLKLQEENLDMYKFWAARYIMYAEKMRIGQGVGGFNSEPIFWSECADWLPMVQWRGAFLNFMGVLKGYELMVKWRVAYIWVRYNEPGSPFTYARVYDFSMWGLSDGEQFAEFAQKCAISSELFAYAGGSGKLSGHKALLYWMKYSTGKSHLYMTSVVKPELEGEQQDWQKELAKIDTEMIKIKIVSLKKEIRDLQKRIAQLKKLNNAHDRIQHCKTTIKKHKQQIEALQSKLAPSDRENDSLVLKLINLFVPIRGMLSKKKDKSRLRRFFESYDQNLPNTIFSRLYLKYRLFRILAHATLNTWSFFVESLAILGLLPRAIGFRYKTFRVTEGGRVKLVTGAITVGTESSYRGLFSGLFSSRKRRAVIDLINDMNTYHTRVFNMSKDLFTTLDKAYGPRG